MGDEVGPQEKKTVEVPQIDIVKGMLEKLTDGVATGMNDLRLGQQETNGKVDNLTGEVAKARTDISDATGRIARLEGRVDDIDTWKKNDSDRVKALATTTSQNDADHDAELAKERAAREALAADVATLLAIGNRLDGALKSNTAKQALAILIAVVGAYLTSKGLK